MFVVRVLTLINSPTGNAIPRLIAKVLFIGLNTIHENNYKRFKNGRVELYRSFLTAGADSVVGTLWEANDMTMAFLMTEFYGNLSKNTGKAGALRQAMLETMKKYPNPQDWAGFTLVGLL
jgi:hypothetical protein